MLKLLTIIFLVIIFILSIVAVSTNNWLVNMPNQVGLWKICNPCVSWDQPFSSLNALRSFTIIMCLASLISLAACYMIPPIYGQKNIIRVCLAVIVLSVILNLAITPVLKKKIEENTSEKNLKLNYGYSYYLQILILILSLIILLISFYNPKVKVSNSPKFEFETTARI